MRKLAVEQAVGETLCHDMTAILENGFKVEGTSACVDPKIYNEAIGQEEAYKNAFEKIWEKEGYLLKQKLFEESQK